MLNLKELREIRDHLESSQNPLFFFDNDVDGLCAFLILRRAINRGRGVAIKSFPDLKEQYLRKVDELNPDAVFIIDKAEVSAEFINGLIERNLPIIWIDHHESKTPKELIDQTNYYNSFPTSEPSTYIAQKVFENKKDLWLAMIGCVGDVYSPDFAKEFERQNPELFNSKIPIFEALHKTEIGKMVRMLNFGLMDSTSNVVALTKYLFEVNGPYDLLEENKKTKQFHKRYSELNDFLNKQISKAEEESAVDSKVLFFTYSGQTSMSSEIANKLYFENPEKLVVVGFKRPDKVNVSIRGKRALEITRKAIENIEGATGGGHIEATGAMIPLDEFKNFKERINNFQL